jgi:hypothetical protein
MTDFRLDDPTPPDPAYSGNPHVDPADPLPLGAWSIIHRDGHFSGAIVFPPQHVYIPALPGGIPSGLNPDYWCNYAPYLNPDWATQWGATLRDGDALIDPDGYPSGVCVGPISLANRFNDVWSQPDVDWAYAKTAVWYNYFQEEPFGAGSGIYTSDVYLVLKTKYLNSVSCSFPFWNSGAWQCGQGGFADYHEAVAQARNGLCNTGKLDLYVTVWDVDENLPPVGSPLPSPGVFRYPIYIDQEMTISRFSINPGPLTNPTVFYSPFEMGQFRIDQMRNYPFRYATVLGDAPDAPGLFGLVYFRHTFGAGDFIRSAMAEWHYVPGLTQK